MRRCMPCVYLLLIDVIATIIDCYFPEVCVNMRASAMHAYACLTLNELVAEVVETSNGC